MNRQLSTYIDNAFVGTLYENTGVWSFQYDKVWVKQGYELSPGLPLSTVRLDDGGTIRPVQWFFDNLLPEADARQQLMMYMQHDVTMGTDAWSMLAHFGAESAGALTLLPPGVALPEAGLLPLSDESLEARIQAMPRQALSAKSLRIPRKLDTRSAANWTLVPAQTGHLFQAKLDTLGVTARGRGSGFTPEWPRLSNLPAFSASNRPLN